MKRELGSQINPDMTINVTRVQGQIDVRLDTGDGKQVHLTGPEDMSTEDAEQMWGAVQEAITSMKDGE